MNLKKIEIIGFKSFADKVVIDFSDGFTCFVGPNGCGKSNIADAIRWTLGEQSAKQLRGQRMEDVIFFGTQNRRAVSYCEVSLIFDNSQRYYRIDSDELRITRKLYRTGDSEYLVNNTNKRLKEILDLFRDTGIGKEGYSIIGQNAVRDIIGLKSAERRRIFEEAAGITKYRAKRNEAEKRLATAQDNLNSAAFRKATIEKDLAPLAEESDKALRAREYRSQLKTLEINDYLYQNEHNEGARQELFAQIEDMVKKITDVNAKIDQKELEYNALVDEQSKLDESKDALHNARTEIKVSHEHARGQNENAKERYKECTERQFTYAATYKQKEGELNQARREIVTAKEKYNAELEKMRDLAKEMSVVEKEVDDGESASLLREKEIEEVNRIILSSADENGDVRVEQASLKVKIDSLTEAIDADKERRNTYKKSYADGQKELQSSKEKHTETCKERDLKAAKLEQAEKVFSDLTNDKQKATENLELVNATINQLSAGIHTMENVMRSNSQYGQGVRTLLNSDRPEIKKNISSLVGDAITVPSNLEVAMEVALGRNAQSIITEDEDATAELVKYLRRVNGGRATFLAVTKVMPRDLRREYREVLEEDGCIGIAADLIRYDRKYRNVMSFLLGSVVIVEDTETGRYLSNKYRNSFRIISLEGDEYAVGGAVIGGSAPSSDSGTMRMEGELKEKKRNLAQCENTKGALLAELKKCDEDLNKLTRIRNLLQMDIQTLDKSEVALSERVRIVEDELGKVLADIEKVTEEISAKQKSLEESRKIYEIATTNVDKTTSNKVNSHEILGKLKREHNEKNDELRLKKTVLNELNEKKVNIEFAMRGYSATGDVATADEKRLSDELLKLAGDMKYNESEIARFERSISDTELSAEDKAKLEVIEGQIKEIDDKKTKMKERIVKINSEKTALSQSSSDYMVKKNLIENMLNSIDSDSRDLASKITEDYGLDYESAKPFRVDDFDAEKASADIKRLRRELNKIGEVSDYSIDLYSNKKTEYEQLVKDYDDVVNSIAEIQKTIDELTTVMEFNFKETFTQVQANFKEVFSEMFGGGTGVLELDMAYGDSVLDAGIEIFAEPIGKKIKHISMLSGGEKTLTAIAILFSIIKIKPMPFCVLDEIEADLDDANANLVAKFLKKYCKMTQFLVISHKKPTMEQADKLYGITMQEYGVSQCVYVQLSDALKHATTT